MTISRVLKTLAVSAALFAGAATFAAAADAVPDLRQACAADFTKLCAGTTPGTPEARKCMRDHEAELSAPCKTAMDARRKAMRDACAGDIAKFCASEDAGGGRVMGCLRQHEAELSATCKAAAGPH